MPSILYRIFDIDIDRVTAFHEMKQMPGCDSRSLLPSPKLVRHEFCDGFPILGDDIALAVSHFLQNLGPMRPRLDRSYCLNHGFLPN